MLARRRCGNALRLTEAGTLTAQLSITHNFGSDSGSQRDVGQAR
jgi:hypothetical protein